MNKLVEQLSRGDHAVEISLRRNRTVKALKECLDRKYVHIKFTETQGGTELGVAIDPEVTDLSRADFDNETGQAHLVGTLTLNYVKVQCVADIDLKSLAGTGHLEPLQE
jgi:Core binding factor beta subunit